MRKKGGFQRSQKWERSDTRINEAIRGPHIRVVGPAGEQLGIFTIIEAMEKARGYDLDLVEVAPTADPPVCKIMDYGKFRYQQQKRAQEAKKRQTVIQVKEIKVRPKIDEHDYQFKLEHVKRFLRGGDKAKVSVMFRGREIVHKEIGARLLDRFLEDTKELGDVESMPKMEGRMMTMILMAKSPKSEKKAKTVKEEESRYGEDENKQGGGKAVSENEKREN